MGMEKAILSGKEKRKPYRRAKAIARSCRNHGGCPWCLADRTYRYDKQKDVAKAKFREWESED